MIDQDGMALNTQQDIVDSVQTHYLITTGEETCPDIVSLPSPDRWASRVTIDCTTEHGEQLLTRARQDQLPA